MSKSALVIITDGAEEIETVCCVDVLRRGGVKTTLASVTECSSVLCSRHMRLVPDCSLAQALQEQPAYDVVVLPGGLDNAKALAKCPEVGLVLQQQEQAGRCVAALCASTIALVAHKIGIGKQVTSHPSVRDQITDNGQYKYTENRVQVDGLIVTSRGPGTAIEFALALVELLHGADKANDVKAPMICP